MRPELYRYIGRRWTSDDNCWDMVREIYSSLLSVQLPQHPAQALRAVGSSWLKLDQPEDLCVVAMAGHAQSLRHAGVYIAAEGGLVLHCARPYSVITPLSRLAAVGYSRYEFYKYEDSSYLPQPI